MYLKSTYLPTYTTNLLQVLNQSLFQAARGLSKIDVLELRPMKPNYSLRQPARDFLFSEKINTLLLLV
jgi:hypothetical protein